MASIVLDTYAMLAYFWDDLGSDKVEGLLVKAASINRSLYMTEVSFMEIKALVVRGGGPTAWQRASSILAGLPIEFHSINRGMAEVAADFKIRCGITVANSFTAALAKQKKAEIAACDSDFGNLESEIKINWMNRN